MFGKILEKNIGATKVLVLYIVSGLYAALSSVVVSEYIITTYVKTVGASGSICGLLGAYLAWSCFQCSIVREQIQPSITKSIIVVIITGICTANTNNICHIGGIVSGFVFMVIIKLCDNIEDSNRHIALQDYFNKKRNSRPGNSRLKI